MRLVRDHLVPLEGSNHTDLRSTITQARLNHLIILHAHRERTDSLCLRDVASDFIA